MKKCHIFLSCISAAQVAQLQLPGQTAMLHLYPFHFPYFITPNHLWHTSDFVKALIQTLVYIQHSLNRSTLEKLFTARHSSVRSLIALLWHKFIPLTVTDLVCAASPVIPPDPSLCHRFCLGSQVLSFIQLKMTLQK